MMATYFNGGSEIQGENLQKLYLVNPSYSATYSDEHQPLILNQTSVHHHLVGIPLAQSGSDLSRQSSFHDVPISAYNHWNTVSELGSPMGFRRQGLSLSLNNSSSPARKNDAVVPTTSVSGSPQSLILGSKYLKAAQQLLDEVVSMAESDSGGIHREEKAKGKATTSDEDKNGGCEALSSSHRQELQMKKSKLLNMLDEVEQRYKQYELQMQRVGWELEQAAGARSSKSYTLLALRTISKQFRCLKDAIASHLKDTGRKLGEEDEEEGQPGTSTRLRMVEKQMRQQRALHQLGMMHQNQHNAWRPQRGLPERAVSVLRAWLFEHFLHPYPKDSDKHMLAKQTGLTRSQVSNWFINARVRLWKPMVEEMYVEEMKGAAHQQDPDSGDKAKNNNEKDDTNKESSTLALKSATPLDQSYNSINDIPNSTLISPRMGSTGPAGFSLIGPTMEPSLFQRSPKRQRVSVLEDLFNSSQDAFGPNSYLVPGPYGQLEQNRYHHHHVSNTVSLTLGLEAHHRQQNFLSGRVMHMGPSPDMGDQGWYPVQPEQHSDGGVDIIQTRKRFAAHLLPDFVA